MEKSPLSKWLNKELSTLLECEVGDEYSENILKIETQTELKEFIGSLLDLTIPKNLAFLNQLLEKLKKPAQLENVTVYKKPEFIDETSTKFKGKKPQKADEEPATNLKQEKKSGFNLFPTEKKGTTRHVCECQATKHKLIGNCLKCGRIVCEQEMSGPCYFCGNLVCTKEESEKINRGSNKGEHLKAELLGRTWKGFENIAQDITNIGLLKSDDEKLKRAIEHKNKLIDYDRTSAKRTQVIDDESDYFNTNSKWLSENQRKQLEDKQQELRDKRFGPRSSKSYTLDFAGRKIVDDKQDISFQSYAKDIENILTEKKEDTYFVQPLNELVNEDIDIKPKFIEDKSKKHATKNVKKEELKEKFRLQDQELQEMKDDGMCLSMHQPWAQLLVNGIKKHEGRTWYTPYRGRLWIHAGSKQISELDIKEVETFYKVFYAGKNVKFPSSYPTSCLIGYVDLSDCLSSEEYENKFPNGESKSEFVFICRNPRELVVKIPMSGQHKIFKLDKNVHSAAKKTMIAYPEEDL